MKYSKSESAYFRKSKKENSIKGGKLKKDGILENSDFLGKNGNNVPKKEFIMKQNNGSFEFKNMNPNKVDTPINSDNPIKIMVQKGTGKIFIFFGYDSKTQTYRYVCYINPNASKLHNIKIICEEMIQKNGSSKIVRLSHREFFGISIEELIVLFYNLLKIRKKHPEFMNELFEYLNTFVFHYQLFNNLNNSNNHIMYKDMVEEIGQMLRNEEIYKQNMMEKQKKKNQIQNKQMLEEWK
jgi:hypothetical protein